MLWPRIGRIEFCLSVETHSTLGALRGKTPFYSFKNARNFEKCFRRPIRAIGKVKMSQFLILGLNSLFIWANTRFGFYIDDSCIILAVLDLLYIPSSTRRTDEAKQREPHFKPRYHD